MLFLCILLSIMAYLPSFLTTTANMLFKFMTLSICPYPQTFSITFLVQTYKFSLPWPKDIIHGNCELIQPSSFFAIQLDFWAKKSPKQNGSFKALKFLKQQYVNIAWQSCAFTLLMPLPQAILSAFCSTLSLQKASFLL